MLTQEKVLRMFRYVDGRLFWNVSRSGARIGVEAGHIRSGYRRVEINGTVYASHRIVFLMHHGYMPEYIDHINGVRDDNRIENLREATRFENCQNAKRRADNSSGAKGVSWHKRIGKWHVEVMANKIRRHIGYFEDLELAELVAQEARNKFHGRFANHG